MVDEIVNKVASSGLITLDLTELLPKEETVIFDIKDALFMGMILKEKDFRDFISQHDWEKYSGKNVAVYCSGDAIIPQWAYMMITVKLQPFAKRIFAGTEEQLQNELYREAINNLDVKEYVGARVIIKGCGDIPVPSAAYSEISRILAPHVKSLMYGEACSNVPVFKKK